MKPGKPYLDILLSIRCQCGSRKNTGKSFCWPCFASLSKPMRQNLYKRIGEGYEQAFDEALARLNSVVVKEPL